MGGRILVIGADSGIGSALLRQAGVAGWQAFGTSRHDGGLDLADSASVAAYQPPRADAAVICAAITSLAACEQEPAATAAVNVAGTLALAGKLKQHGIHPIGLSTNLVFDGSSVCAHADAPVAPQTAYGGQKAEMERGILGLGGSVVRLTKVVSVTTALLLQWRQDIQANQPVTPFRDMVMAPIPLMRVITALLNLAAKPVCGVFQLSASHDISYADAAGFLAAGNAGLVRPVGAPQTIARAAMPRHTALNTSHAEAVLGWRPITPEETLAEVFS